jgi:ATP-dependent helicase/DNAse subunit B
MEVYVAPVGMGKTEAVQQRILDLKAAQPFARVWVLLATKRQIVDFRRRLMARDDALRVAFNIEYFSFYELYRRILLETGEPQRRLTDSARVGTMRLVLDELRQRGQLPLLGSISSTPGFVRIAADFIYQLKQSLIDPDTFTAAAQRTDDRKLQELALIYADYQGALVQNNLVDREGEGWVALSAVWRSPDVLANVDLLVCDGYDQFNLLQARLLTKLSTCVKACITTLTTVPGREQGVGRRFSRALESLIERHNEEGLSDFFDMQLRWELYDSQAAARSSQPLRQLADQFYAPVVTPYPHQTHSLRLIEAPDVRSEVAAVLRAIKRLLLEGTHADDILVAVRDWESYRRAFSAAGLAYGVPLLLHRGESLIENPAVAALVDMLELATGDFKRRELLDVLRSPYFDLPHIIPEWVDALDAISQAAYLTEGRADWLNAIQPQPNMLLDPDESDETDPDPIIDPVSADLLRSALDMFFDAVTPPESGAVSDYVRWLEHLIGADTVPDADDSVPDDEVTSPNGIEPKHEWSLNALRCVRAHPDAMLVARDLAALKACKRLLAGMINAESLIRALRHSADQRIAWSEFWGAFKTALAANAALEDDRPLTARDGRVLVTLVTDARGLPHRHLCIVGLSEGVFPARIAEDPLLLDSERRALGRLGVDLPTSDQRADEDSLFYELINLASDTLTLSRFTLKDGADVLPSPLWDGVRAVFPDVEVDRLRPGQAVAAHDAAALDETMIAVSADPTMRTAPYAAWLRSAHAAAWSRVQFGQRIELRRLARQIAHDSYSGVLGDPDLIARVRDQLGTDRVWSATQFNEYGTCGFRFFARRMLRLEKRKPPEAGMDGTQYGQIIHEVLEATYKAIRLISPDHLDGALRILDDQMDRLLPTAPQRFGFRPSSLWTQEQRMLRRRLRRVITADFANGYRLTALNSAERRVAFRLEAPFGGENDTTRIEIGGESISVRGRIDRIDKITTPEGEALVVIDYKTSATKIQTDEIVRGRNFQMMLYIRAVEQWARTLPDAPRVAGGAFVHISSTSASGWLSPHDSDVIDAGIDHVARLIAAGRQGNFAVYASKFDGGKCASSCDYAQFCRAAVVSRQKPRS